MEQGQIKQLLAMDVISKLQQRVGNDAVKIAELESKLDMMDAAMAEKEKEIKMLRDELAK